MNDPLKSTDSREHQLFEQVTALLNGLPSEMVRVIAINVLVNAIRQSVPYRNDAEELFNELTGRAKALLLDKHYDLVTGRRRSVFPFTQVIEAPFHVEQDVVLTTSKDD
jgi:hypothetical protein